MIDEAPAKRVRVPRLGFHKPTGQWRINSRRFGCRYFGHDAREARRRYRAWVAAEFPGGGQGVAPRTIPGLCEQWAEERGELSRYYIAPFQRWVFAAGYRTIEQLRGPRGARSAHLSRYADWLAGQEYAPETRRHYAGAVNQWLAWAGSRGYARTSGLRVPLPRVPRLPPRNLDGPELARLVNGGRSRSASRILRVLYLTGARRAQDLLRAGVQLDVVASLLGHSGLRMVQRYTYADVGRLKAALAAALPLPPPPQAPAEKPAAVAAAPPARKPVSAKGARASGRRAARRGRKTRARSGQ